ncbi:divergent protein kinase domain 1C-like isoform X1 [Diadema antillarum]|uniref:divergent protein kinase domain 1C-like isoform X1 n=2 Tax=Diadema antillarum TaxID=105358 RepID=UPI003A836CD9
MRRVSKKLLFRSLMLGAVSVILYLGNQLTRLLSYECPNHKGKEIVQNLCLLYKNSLVDGNLCADLCESGALKYVSCFNYLKGKVVFQGTWNGEPVILKSKFSQLSDYSQPYASVIRQNGDMRTIVPDMGLFKSMVRHTVEGQFGFDLKLSEEELLKRMWRGAGQSRMEDLTEPEIVSLWALLQQEEFVAFQYWNGFHHYPQVHGTCGHFYILENVPPGFILNPGVVSVQEQLASLPWLNRARIALGMMDFVAAMDGAFPEKLHLCDVKHDNFGVSADFVVKAIDVDITFYQNQLDITLNQPDCTSDADCHFFDCKGTCDMAAGKCNSQRKNTNLQAVCSDIFSRHFGTPGLLRYPPTQVANQLDLALQDCLHQTRLPSRMKVSETAVFKRLFELLEESLKYVERHVS